MELLIFIAGGAISIVSYLIMRPVKISRKPALFVQVHKKWHYDYRQTYSDARALSNELGMDVQVVMHPKTDDKPAVYLEVIFHGEAFEWSVNEDGEMEKSPVNI